MRKSPIFFAALAAALSAISATAPRSHAEDDRPPELDVKLPRVAATDTKSLFKLVGQRAIVSGKVGRTKDWEGTSPGKGINFINFERAQFVVVCFERDYGNFDARPAVKFRGKFLEVVGVIKEYKGKPEIELVKPVQVLKALDAPPAEDGDVDGGDKKGEATPGGVTGGVKKQGEKKENEGEKVDPDAFFRP